MTWSVETIAGQTADVFTPTLGIGEKAVIYLHAYGQERLSENPDITCLFDEHQLAAVCPRGGTCWWLDQVDPSFDPELTPMEYVRTRVVEWIGRQWGIVPPRIGLFGISMGGQGVLNLAYRHARTFPVVAAIAPAVDFHSIHGRGYSIDEIFPDAETARQQTATLHLHPLNWPRFQFFACDPRDTTWFEGCERLASKLSSSGVPFESDLETSHGGHNWTYFTAMAERAVSHLARGLSQL